MAAAGCLFYDGSPNLAADCADAGMGFRTRSRSLPGASLFSEPYNRSGQTFRAKFCCDLVEQLRVPSALVRGSGSFSNYSVVREWGVADSDRRPDAPLLACDVGRGPRREVATRAERLDLPSAIAFPFHSLLSASKAEGSTRTLFCVACISWFGCINTSPVCPW